MTSIPDADLTCDAFLGGRLRLCQPRRGYRAGLDPVLLAAAVPAEAGQSVLDLGTGVGTALLCLGTRVTGLFLSGVEIQERYAEIARLNAQRSGIALDILTGNVAAMPAVLRSRRFDHVISNPPFFDRRGGTASRDAERESAKGETLALAEWVTAGAKRLAPRGHMTLIQKADRLPDLLGAMASTVGSLKIRPIQPRIGRPASLVIVQGIKGGRAPARIEAPLVLHEGDVHRADGDDYSPAARAILRDSAAFA